MKRIAVLTSGGDAPGMNACIRTVVRTAIYNGMEVFGVKRGYYGLVNDDLFEMGMRSVSDIVQRGGTILHTARCLEFKELAGQQKAVDTLKRHGIEGLLVLGGDGSFRGARDISLLGIPTIGIPGTIDNDLAYTDYSIGFDTAVNTCLDVINKLRDTMSSHERISVVEVMGRHCGDIALYAGVAGGAEIIITPEKKVKMSAIIDKINTSRACGKSSNIIVLAEGAGNAEEFSERLQKLTHYSVRSTVVGHMQRGGSPSNADRILASQFGYHAVELLEKGVGNRVIGIRNNKIVDYDIIEALGMKKRINKKLYKIAETASM